MESYKYAVVGGGIAGTTAAETLRAGDPTAAIVLIGDEPFPLYSKVMMSKPGYFLGQIPEEKIWLKKPEWYSDNKINYLMGKSVIALDVKTNTLTIEGGEQMQFEKLLIATGGSPRVWKTPGAEKAGIFSLRRMDDFKKIKTYMPQTKKMASVGGGFISFEICDVMKMSGADVTLLLRENYFWEPILDKDSGKLVEDAMEKGGIKIMRTTEIKEVFGNDKVTGVLLNNGEKLDLDMLVVGIGTCAVLDFLKDSGVAVNCGILADEYLKTNLPNIWTAGDVAEFSDVILEEQVQLGNWVNAQAQGRVAALNMLGQTQPFKLVSSYNTSGFGINVAFTGDVRPEKTKRAILRKSADSQKIIQLFEKFGELVGATFVNGMDEMATVNKLIENDTKVTGTETQLADPAFDLKSLIK